MNDPEVSEEMIRLLINAEETMVYHRRLTIDDYAKLEAYFYDQWNWENDSFVNKELMNKAARMRKQCIEQDLRRAQVHQSFRATAAQMAAQQQQANLHALQQQQHMDQQRRIQEHKNDLMDSMRYALHTPMLGGILGGKKR